jgi:hypothetical protein
MLNETTKRTNPLFVLLMGIVFVLLLVWLIPAGLSGDIRWFLPGVSEHPRELIIWDHGETVALHPGDAEYGPITAALEAALTSIYGSSEYGPSSSTVNDYRHSFALEVFYESGLQIHSRFNLGHPTQVLIPLTEVGYAEGRFFVGSNGAYWAAGPRAHGLETVHAAVLGVLQARGMPTPPAGFVVEEPTAAPTDTAVSGVAPTVTPPDSRPPLGAVDTYEKLTTTLLPPRDLYSITQRLKLKSREDVPHTVNATPPNYQVGDRQVFSVSNVQTKSYYTLTAELKAVTDHAYWYVADGYDVPLAALQKSAQVFETKIYPTNRATFGEEPAPGIDNDPHITVLNAPIPGVGGYFSSADQYPKMINPFSNERKMIYIATMPGGSYYDATIAHEFQHMIHWNVHPNQDVWINEGMAELAMALNGFSSGGPEIIFRNDPDVQLNHWADSPDKSIAHYGSSYLFMQYIYQQYGGGPAIQAILNAPTGDTEAISDGLAVIGESDRFPQVFHNWVLANYLDSKNPGGRYEYPKLDMQVDPSAHIDQLPGHIDDTVHQQAADYIELDASAATGDPVTVNFQGSERAPVLSSTPINGNGFWYSNKADVMDSQMTRYFNLGGQTGPITLNFALWYDIERDFDYGYVMASSDGGISWDTLKGKYTTDTNPNGTNLGNGYTGVSTDNGDTATWVQESVDLSAYAGKELMLRFEYITDDGYNAQGLAVDDIRIPQINYQETGETASDGEWDMHGFVHIGNEIPQNFLVDVITFDKDDKPTVQPMALDGKNHGSLTVPAFGTDVRRATVVIAALAPRTIQEAHYVLDVTAGAPK